jgi:MFS family permease
MSSGGWPSILSIYCFGVLGTACQTKFVPLAGDFLATFNAGPVAFGLLIALYGVPPAVLGGIGGSFVDRMVPRRILVISACIGCAADVLYFFAGSMLVFDAARVLEGFAMVGIFTAAPALLMSTTAGTRRVTAMTLWSTYTPVGFAIGLGLAGGFAGTTLWRVTFLCHGILFAVAGVLALGLPDTGVRKAPVARYWGARLKALLSIYSRPGPVRLALTFGLINCMKIGVSTVMPYYFVRKYALSIGAASNFLAVSMLVMIAGAVITNAWLRHGLRASQLFVGFAAAGLVAAGSLFIFATPLTGALIALCIWQIAAGGAASFALAVLPAVVTEPQHGAAAGGLISQVAGIVSLTMPPVWLSVFAGGGGLGFFAMTAAGWLGAFLILPPAAAHFLLPRRSPALATYTGRA